MRSFRWLIALVFFFSGAAAMLRPDGKGDEVRASLHSITPDSARPGDTVVATGDHLAAKFLAELYLTDGKDDIRVEILKQTNTEVTF